MFFYIKCVLFVLVLSISGEISAQEKRDSVRIYFLHRQVSGDYQRLAYIINDYQGVHFERLSF